MSDKASPTVARVDETLVNDPEFPWEDGHLYELLNHRLAENNQPPLGPHSSMKQVLDAGFSVQGHKRESKAWYDLKDMKNRLVIDFLHYPVPDFRLEMLDPASLERPMPVAPCDLLGIADCHVELAGIPAAPAKISAHRVQLSRLIDFGIAELLPSPLCAHDPQLLDVIGSEDDDA
jgi:hypothetical protein